MIIRQKNFVNMDPSLIPKADEYEDCNFARSQPDTSGPEVVGVRLWPGDDTPRVFTNCNLMNCEVPPGSRIVNCNTWIVETRVPAFSEDVVVDNVTVATEQFHDRTVHARYVDSDYDRTGFPQTTPEDY